MSKLKQKLKKNCAEHRHRSGRIIELEIFNVYRFCGPNINKMDSPNFAAANREVKSISMAIDRLDSDSLDARAADLMLKGERN